VAHVIYPWIYRDLRDRGAYAVRGGGRNASMKHGHRQQACDGELLRRLGPWRGDWVVGAGPRGLQARNGGRNHLGAGTGPRLRAVEVKASRPSPTAIFRAALINLCRTNIWPGKSLHMAWITDFSFMRKCDRQEKTVLGHPLPVREPVTVAV
jgi:hypothetical protein